MVENIARKIENHSQTQIIAKPGKQELTIIRELTAPRELVFKAHTDPELFKQWIGPRQLTTTFEKLEPVSGGSWRFTQRDADGTEYAFHGVYHEIAFPEMIIGTFEFEGLPEKGHVSLTTTVFEELPGNKTRLTSQSVYRSAADRDAELEAGMEQGVNEGYERLDELLYKMKSESLSSDEGISEQQDLVITRLFDVPREQVWRAWTDPEIVKRWWGPKGFTAPVVNIDLRVGGTILYCMRSPEGKDYWGTGVYREIVELERIVNTDSFADENGNIVPAPHYGLSPDFPMELLVKVTFKEQQGKTKFTLRHIGIPPGQDLDNTRAGWNESLDKLADVLRS